MINYINILRIYNIICILLLGSASIIVFINYKDNVLEFIVAVYTMCFIPATLYLTCNQGNIENYLFNTNSYYYIMFLLYFNFGLLFCGIKETLGCGLIVIGCSIFNLMVGVLNEDITYNQMDRHKSEETIVIETKETSPITVDEEGSFMN